MDKKKNRWQCNSECRCYNDVIAVGYNLNTEHSIKYSFILKSILFVIFKYTPEGKIISYIYNYKSVCYVVQADLTTDVLTKENEYKQCNYTIYNFCLCYFCTEMRLLTF